MRGDLEHTILDHTIDEDYDFALEEMAKLSSEDLNNLKEAAWMLYSLADVEVDRRRGIKK